MRRIILFTFFSFTSLSGIAQYDEWSSFGPWVNSDCFYIQYRVRSYYDSKQGKTSFEIEWKNNYSRGISFKDVNFSDVRQADAFFKDHPANGGTQSNIRLEANKSKIYKSGMYQIGTGKQTYVYIYHLEMEGNNRKYSACTNGQPDPACINYVVSDCPNYKTGSKSSTNQNNTFQQDTYQPSSNQTTYQNNQQQNIVSQQELVRQQQNIVNQQEQARQQEIILQQKKDQQTAAYVDLGVQAVQGIASLIAIGRDAKREKLSAELAQINTKEKQEAEYKKINQFNEIRTLEAQYKSSPSNLTQEKIADIYSELAKYPYYYNLTEEEIVLFRDYSNKIYNNLIASNYYTFNVICKYLETFSNEKVYTDKVQRKKNFSVIYKYLTDKFLESNAINDGKTYFAFAKTHSKKKFPNK